MAERNLLLTVRLTYDPDIMHDDDPAAVEWWRREILGGPLLLHSNELGDTVGEITVLWVEDDDGAA